MVTMSRDPKPCPCGSGGEDLNLIETRPRMIGYANPASYSPLVVECRLCGLRSDVERRGWWAAIEEWNAFVSSRQGGEDGNDDGVV